MVMRNIRQNDDHRSVHCGTGSRCPRPACGVSIEPEKFCCSYCYQLVPVSIRLHLESEVIQRDEVAFAKARAAAVESLRKTRITCALRTKEGHSLAIRRGLRRKHG